jgi:hypothetical protein
MAVTPTFPSRDTLRQFRFRPLDAIVGAAIPTPPTSGATPPPGRAWWHSERRLRAALPRPGVGVGKGPGLAFHCLDVPFVFDTLSEPGVTEVAGPSPPSSLAADMHGAWVRFVTSGDPGWDRCDAGRRPVMVFDEPWVVHEDPLQMQRAAWA